MGNFANVTLGTGSLSYDSVDIGFLKGNVEWTYQYDVKKFKTGVPKTLQGQIVAELSASMKASYAELNATNVAMALGGLSITNTTATPVVVPFGATPAESVGVFTFVNDPVTGCEYIQLAPGVVISSVASITVKNAAEDATFAIGKYIIFPTSGRLYRVVTGSGDIGSGATVHVAYTYTPVTGKRINLGTQFSLAQKPLLFTHTRPSGLEVQVYMPLATIQGSIKTNFDEENFIVNDVIFDAVNDTTHNPTCPFGYYFEET